LSVTQPAPIKTISPTPGDLCQSTPECPQLSASGRPHPCAASCFSFSLTHTVPVAAVAPNENGDASFLSPQRDYTSPKAAMCVPGNGVRIDREIFLLQQRARTRRDGDLASELNRRLMATRLDQVRASLLESKKIVL
jgi:hypothetical protein